MTLLNNTSAMRCKKFQLKGPRFCCLKMNLIDAYENIKQVLKFNQSYNITHMSPPMTRGRILTESIWTVKRYLFSWKVGFSGQKSVCLLYLRLLGHFLLLHNSRYPWLGLLRCPPLAGSSTSTSPTPPSSRGTSYKGDSILLFHRPSFFQKSEKNFFSLSSGGLNN